MYAMRLEMANRPVQCIFDPLGRSGPPPQQTSDRSYVPFNRSDMEICEEHSRLRFEQGCVRPGTNLVRFLLEIGVLTLRMKQCNRRCLKSVVSEKSDDNPRATEPSQLQHAHKDFIPYELSVFLSSTL
jgi:hypothetical protein